MAESRKQLSALTPDDLITLLQRSGSKHVSLELLERQIAEGFALNPDGTINFFHYVAFLLERSNG